MNDNWNSVLSFEDLVTVVTMSMFRRDSDASCYTGQSKISYLRTYFLRKLKVFSFFEGCSTDLQSLVNDFALDGMLSFPQLYHIQCLFTQSNQYFQKNTTQSLFSLSNQKLFELLTITFAFSNWNIPKQILIPTHFIHGNFNTFTLRSRYKGNWICCLTVWWSDKIVTSFSKSSCFFFRKWYHNNMRDYGEVGPIFSSIFPKKKDSLCSTTLTPRIPI